MDGIPLVTALVGALASSTSDTLVSAGHGRSIITGQLVVIMIFAMTLASCASSHRHRALDGSRSLFDGHSLSGWHAIGGGSWEVVDDAILGTSSKDIKAHGLLVSDQRFSDFIVTFEYRLTAGDSGFYFRVDEVDGAVGVNGFQVEVDDVEPGGLYETGGRAWVIKHTPEEAVRWHRSGEWNRVKLEASGTMISVWVNGIQTAMLDDPQGRRSGHFALQLHGGQDMHVEYRDIRVLDLADPS